MSYLDWPRFCFLGTFTAFGPTRNNLLAALDDPALLEPPNNGWDNHPEAAGNFQIKGCNIVAAWDRDGRFIDTQADDPIIGQVVNGNIAKMADLDPEHRRVTDLIGAKLTVVLSEGIVTLSGTMEPTQLRDYWNNSVGSTVTSWQSVIPGPWPKAPKGHRGVEGSEVINQLHEASPRRLSVKLTLYAPGPPPWTVVGAVGPTSEDEPQQFVAARRLITTIRPSYQLPFPVASFKLDETRRRLVVDLSNLTLDASQQENDILVRGLVASMQLENDWRDELGPPRDLSVRQWLRTAGIVEWVLTAKQTSLLDCHRLQLRLASGGENLIMEEHPSGKYVDIDRRSLRLNPGESEAVRVYARQLGKPLAGQIVEFGLKQQFAFAPVQTILDPSDPGFPPDRYRLINSTPADVLVGWPGPTRVTTGEDGFADLTIQVKPGTIDLPNERKTIDSQLYFLGDPDGWQSWGAIGPNNGDLGAPRIGAGCALTVLVFNTYPEIPHPAWENVKDGLARYATLYPAMKNVFDLGDKDTVTKHAAQIKKALTRKWDDVNFMPITRDLSSFDLRTIVAYLEQLLKKPSRTRKDR